MHPQRFQLKRLLLNYSVIASPAKAGRGDLLRLLRRPPAGGFLAMTEPMDNILVLNVYKPVSYTPLQIIDQLREKYPEFKHETLAYAGRLDPMAEGVLLILVGDECKKRKEYERLKKVYEVEILWGISTDTYDIMGIITEIHRHVHPRGVRDILNSFVGKQTQPYPPYSSVRVNGKPLYYWARENKLDEISIPTKEVEIYDIKYLGDKSIQGDELLQNIEDRITKVKGKFRQEEIISKWNGMIPKSSNLKFKISNLSVSCSSGTYMRSLAHNMGEILDIPALAYSIKRTQVGTYTLDKSIRFQTIY